MLLPGSGHHPDKLLLKNPPQSPFIKGGREEGFKREWGAKKIISKNWQNHFSIQEDLCLTSVKE